MIEQYEPHDLNHHLANGRPWDLDRTRGGLVILPPYQRLDALDGDESAGDYGDRLIPDLLAGGGVVEHRLEGHWRDVGTIAAFHRAHMELTAPDPPVTLDDPDWPFLTSDVSVGPARVAATARSASGTSRMSRSTRRGRRFGLERRGDTDRIDRPPAHIGPGRGRDRGWIPTC